MRKRWASFEALRADLVSELGEEAVLRLMDAFAGRSVYVPANAGETHPITVAIGAEAAAILCEFWHRTELEFPAAASRRQRILDLKASGRSNGEIATALLVSERHVREVLAEQRDSRQLSLL
jgi:DNA-binding NarL/FixJ family response regulator